MMKNKKGQIKIQQMVFMLIAVIMFFALVGIFVLSFKFSNLKESAAALEEENAKLLVSKIANSPEFSCENAFGNKIDCIDADKAMMLKNKLKEYKDFWGVSNIEILKIFPEGEVICTSQNYPECNRIIFDLEKTTGTYVSNFVSLCRKESFKGSVYDKCELAKIMVSYEE